MNNWYLERQYGNKMFKHEKTEYFLLRLADLIQCNFKAKKDLDFFQLK